MLSYDLTVQMMLNEDFLDGRRKDARPNNHMSLSFKLGCKKITWALCGEENVGAASALPCNVNARCEQLSVQAPR